MTWEMVSQPIDSIYGTTIIPKLWSIDGYGRIAERLKRELNLTDGENFFEFPYDWRRDNRVAARRLKRLATGWLEAWQKKQNDPGARIILIAHSMGGLISRYFIEVLEGWRITRQLVTLGTPHRGSLNAVDFLANGYGKSVLGVRLLDLSETLRSFTSVYQLLPIYPCIKLNDDKMARPSEIDVPRLDRARTRAADAFYREIYQAAMTNREEREYRDAACRITPVVGTFQPTFQVGKITGEHVEMLGRHPAHELQGDGTVPQISAYPIEWDVNTPESKVVYATERHSGIQNSDSVLANVIGTLGGFDVDLGQYRGGSALALEIADLFSANNPISFTVSSQEPLRRFSVRLESVDCGAVVLQSEFNARSAMSQWIETGKIPEGVYRFYVRRPAIGRPDDSVSEVLLVM